MVTPGRTGLRHRHKHMDLSQNKQDSPMNIIARGTDGCTLGAKSTVTGARGADGCTLGAEKHCNWSQRYRQMYP